jgi:pimeloyl-ACP methyl ester carboxylesterase
MLAEQPEIRPDGIGLIGYSQAGWVLPLVAGKSDYPHFMIVVSGAINWMEQGAWLTRMRLQDQDAAEAQIQRAIDSFYKSSDRYLSPESSYEEYLESFDEERTENLGPPMSRQRFQFVKLNRHYDASASLRDIQCPTLAVFGKHDKNVPIDDSITAYTQSFRRSGNKDLTINTFLDAQHSLLKADYFPETNPGIGFILKLEFLGDAAFADGFLDFVTNWIRENTSSRKS